MVNDLIDIITRINGGQMLPEQEDAETIIDLESSDVKLYFDKLDKRFYFFADYIVDEEGDNSDDIQKATICNPVLEDRHVNPSDAYLIYFWKVNEIDDNIRARVIEIEENEFFYKKYVIYYTEAEYKALDELIRSMGHINLSILINYLSTLGDELKGDSARFLVRIITKIPFWNLSFKSAELVDYEDMVNSSIERMTRVDKRESLQTLKAQTEGMAIGSELMAVKLFEIYLGGIINEV